MPRKTTPPPVGLPRLDAGRAYVALNKQLEEGEQIAAAGADESAYATWVAETKHWVEQSFGENSIKAREFEGAGGVGFVITSNMGPADFAEIRREGLSSQLNLLRAFARVLKQTAELGEDGGHHADRAGARPTAATLSTRVFVVHGHDDGAKQTVARFLERLDLQPIILHEQPSGGRTIIEKFEAYADVAFAVVLLTPDDRGGTMANPFEKQSPRARQNVILELGYFLGRLGRERVCGLYKEGTEIPSDFQGVLFVPMDAPGAWRLLLGRELKQVMPGVDLNKAT